MSCRLRELNAVLLLHASCVYFVLGFGTGYELYVRFKDQNRHEVFQCIKGDDHHTYGSPRLSPSSCPDRKRFKQKSHCHNDDGDHGPFRLYKPSTDYQT